MEICYVTIPNYPTPSSGRGQDRYAYELIKGVAELPQARVTSISSRTNKANYLIKELETVSILRTTHANVYHATSEYGLRSILITRRKPTVVTVHDLIPYLFLKHSPIVYANQLVQLSLARLADRIITHSRFYRELLTRVYRISSELIDVNYYGVDHQVFHRRSGRTRNSIPRVLFLGSLKQLKGIRDIIEAVARFAKNSQVELLIAGRGKHWKDLKEVADDSDIGNLTSFLGFVDEKDLPSLYNSVDALVWPSRSGFGLPILEAMSCGTPVVAAECLDAIEYVGDGGLAYKPGDVIGLEKRLESILESDKSWNYWSERAWNWSQKFSWKTMTSQIFETYRNLTRTKEDENLRSIEANRIAAFQNSW